jgi:hypothetical protein
MNFHLMNFRLTKSVKGQNNFHQTRRRMNVQELNSCSPMMKSAKVGCKCFCLHSIVMVLNTFVAVIAVV